MTPAIILSIAGSDSSGGAGIQADIKTITSLGGYAASAITAITAQNTLGIHSVYPLPAQILEEQIDAVLVDLRVQAIKIGMIYDATQAYSIASCLHRCTGIPIIYDCVMCSTSGKPLMTTDTWESIAQALLPLCTLLTPNLPEASYLLQHDIDTIEDQELAAQMLVERYGLAVLLKGGHRRGALVCDSLALPEASRCITYTAPMLHTTNLHGTGCTLSAAIATFMAQGLMLAPAVSAAQHYLHRTIIAAQTLRIGQGNGPLWHLTGQDS